MSKSRSLLKTGQADSSSLESLVATERADSSSSESLVEAEKKKNSWIELTNAKGVAACANHPRESAAFVTFSEHSDKDLD